MYRQAVANLKEKIQDISSEYCKEVTQKTDSEANLLTLTNDSYFSGEVGRGAEINTVSGSATFECL